MKKILIFFICTGFAFCAQLNIAAAANIASVFDELKTEFLKTHKKDDLKVSLASSGKLIAQIKNSAPFDVFMAANVDFAQDIVKSGFSDGKSQIYATGKLALLSVRGFDVKQGLDILKDSKIKTIVIANPKTAPYGTAALQALKNYGIYEDIKHKIIEANSIGEALSQTISAADVGFVAASSLYTDKMKEHKNNFILVNEKLYEPIKQAMVVIKNSKNKKLAQEFFDFVLSQKGKAIFQKYGYGI